MKRLSLALSFALMFSSVSNAFCLKQYNKTMNRFTASMVSNAKKHNFAAVQVGSVSPAESTSATVRRQK